MKKLFVVLFAVLFLAGFVWAQGNNATITQNGNNYQATIDQTGSGNDGTIDQASSGYSKASITQVGNNNIGDVYWRNTSGYGGGEIIIIQEGEQNKAYHKNYSFSPAYQNDRIYQYGDQNYAFQRYRYGTNPSGSAEIYQGLSGTPGDLNEAIQDLQGGGYAKVEQYGNNNIARQRTSSGNGYQHTNIKQEGDGNDADVSAAFPYEPFDNTFDFDFDNPTGAIPVSQYQTGGVNVANTNISGDNNHTTQWQEGGGNVANLDIGQTQFSSDNTAQQIQLNGGNTATMDINGDANIASQYQDGGHTSTININGNNNLAIVHQTN